MKRNQDLGELIPIQEENGRQAVSARTLYGYLGATERFQNWFDRQLKYGFVEEEDFVGCKVFNTLANQEIQDYALTLNMAKEVCMVQRNKKGRLARQYFIEAEKKLKALVQNQQPKLPSNKELAMMVIQAEEERERLSLENKTLQHENEQKSERIAIQEEEIKKSAPKVQFYDNVMQSTDTLTATQVAKMLGMPDANRLNKKLVEAGICYRQSGQILLHTPYCTWKLHDTRTQTFTRSDGTHGSNSYTVWGYRGVRFIHALYNNEWNVKKAINAINGQEN